MIKNPSTMQGVWVPSFYWEYPLEKEMAHHSSIFAEAVPRAKEPTGYSLQGSKESDMTEHVYSPG